MLKRFDFESCLQWLPAPAIAFDEAAVATTLPAALPSRVLYRHFQSGVPE
jgi:hypothetical protein